MLKFVKDKPMTGIVAGGVASALGVVGGAKVGAKLVDPASPDGLKTKVGMWLATNPWAGGAVLGAASFAALWFTKKKTAAWASAATSAAVLAPSVLASVMAPSAAASLPAAGAQSGLGVAVAESRGFGAPPSIDVFSEAPSNIQLLGNANNPDTSLIPAANNPSVFGGASF